MSLGRAVLRELLLRRLVSAQALRFAAAAATPAAAASTTKTSVPVPAKKSMFDDWGKVIIPERMHELKPMPKDFKENPERDVVNFPHHEIPVWPSKVRLGFVPDSYFQFFYKKTGVTGPYLFGIGLFSFLMSKEILVVEEEFNHILPVLFILYVGHRLAGPKIETWVNERFHKDLDQRYAFKNEVMAKVAWLRKDYADKLASYQGLTQVVPEIKKENIALQLEATYRERLNNVYKEVKRRLDYLSESESAKIRFAQRHMVQWIVDQVIKSITAEQEKAYATKCIDDLKLLAKAG